MHDCPNYYLKRVIVSWSSLYNETQMILYELKSPSDVQVMDQRLFLKLMTGFQSG